MADLIISLTTGSAEPADYTVSSDAEWTAVFANDTATLDGKIVEVSGSSFTRRTIANHNFSAGLTIRGADASAAIPGLFVSGTTSKVTFQGLGFQYDEWPASHNSVVEFGSGTFTDIEFNGCTFRHGYGPSQVDFDVATQYDEYTRVDNVQTATTTSATYALSYQDATATSARVFFFNRGSNGVHVEFGGSGVTATTGNTLVAAGAWAAIPVNPTTDTHVAIISASGTSEVNARTEIGLPYYLTEAFAASGAANFSGTFKVIGCAFTDLANACKGAIRSSGDLVVMDNDFRRIYMDIISGFVSTGGGTYFLRNTMDTPFARSGIAENLNGDANDPHGDIVQLFATGAQTLGPIYVADNHVRAPRRDNSQGVFFSDNDTSPSYRGIYVVGNTFLPGLSNGIAAGEGLSYPASDVYIWGNVVIDGGDLSTKSNIGLSVNENGFVADNIVGGILNKGPFAPEVTAIGNLVLNGYSGAETAYFANWADLAAADTRAEILAALAPSGDADGLGVEAVTNASAINTATSDYTQVITWANAPSGAAWNSQVEQATASVITFDLKTVLNPAANQAVVPGAGVEWRSTEADGTTEVQAWTSESGTINGGQKIQVRATSNASAGSSDTFSIAINGFTTSFDIQTAGVLIDPFVLNGAFFYDPSDVPANTSVIEYEMKFRPSATAATANDQLFGQVSAGGARANGAGVFSVVSIEDSSGVVVQDENSNTFSLAASVVTTVNVKVDFDVGILDEEGLEGLRYGEITASQSGKILSITRMTDTTGLAQSYREVAFCALDTSVAALPSTWEVEYMKVWFTTGGVRTLRKEISVAALGSIANINADGWHQGSNVIAPA